MFDIILDFKIRRIDNSNENSDQLLCSHHQYYPKKLNSLTKIIKFISFQQWFNKFSPPSSFQTFFIFMIKSFLTSVRLKKTVYCNLHWWGTIFEDSVGHLESFSNVNLVPSVISDENQVGQSCWILNSQLQSAQPLSINKLIYFSEGVYLLCYNSPYHLQLINHFRYLPRSMHHLYFLALLC
jgi:hypothetical protein